MPSFSLAELLAAPSAATPSYVEVLRVATLSAGVYALAAGDRDEQEPHTEDEVYVVLRGRSRATVGDDIVDLAPGSMLYVPAGVVHRFQDIDEDLVVLVLFAPPEGTQVS